MAVIPDFFDGEANAAMVDALVDFKLRAQGRFYPKVRLEPLEMTSLTSPVVSTMPVNIDTKLKFRPVNSKSPVPDFEKTVLWINKFGTGFEIFNFFLYLRAPDSGS